MSCQTSAAALVDIAFDVFAARSPRISAFNTVNLPVLPQVVPGNDYRPRWTEDPKSIIQTLRKH